MGTTATQHTRRTHANSSAPKAAGNGRVSVPHIDLRDPSLYLNRELSLLAFQRRVLEEAQDETNPLLERVKFLSIVGSNLDEFFMVRVAGLKRQQEAGSQEVGPDGMSPEDQLEAIRTEVSALMMAAARCYRKQLAPALEAAGIYIRTVGSLTEQQQARAAKHFEKSVFPVLTPLAFDPGRPFPHISNLSVNLAVLIRDRAGNEHFARVKVPDSLPQLVDLNGSTKPTAKRRRARRTGLVWLEQLIQANLGALFPGMQVVKSHPFHVTRDAEMAIKELEAEDLLETIEEGLRQRRFRDV